LNLYTPLHEAKEEIWRRWNDKALREEVSAYLGDIPDLFKETPHAMLWRWIATPNFETIRFLALASQVELPPFLAEYADDKFCTMNPDKLYLGKMVFIQESKDQFIKSHINIIDIPGNDGRIIKEIQTHWGCTLIDAHHSLWNGFYPDIKLTDFTSWFSSLGNNIHKRYELMLALFLCHGVLFENYIINDNHYFKHERKFVIDVIMPAFQKIQELFGLKPLIVPLVTPEEEGDLYWNYYPGFLKQEVEKLMNGNGKQ